MECARYAHVAKKLVRFHTYSYSFKSGLNPRSGQDRNEGKNKLFAFFFLFFFQLLMKCSTCAVSHFSALQHPLPDTLNPRKLWSESDLIINQLLTAQLNTVTALVTVCSINGTRQSLTNLQKE